MSAEVRNAATETGSATEMPAATETRAPATEVTAATAEMAPSTAEVAAATAEVAPTATSEMATAAATSTVRPSGAGRYGGARSEYGHGKDLEDPAWNPCMCHPGHHVTSLRRCSPLSACARL